MNPVELASVIVCQAHPIDHEIIGIPSSVFVDQTKVEWIIGFARDQFGSNLRIVTFQPLAEILDFLSCIVSDCLLTNRGRNENLLNLYSDICVLPFVSLG